MKGLQQNDFGQKQAKHGVYMDLRILKGLGNKGRERAITRVEL